ncbi:MAG: hypothetical protein K0R41_840 [Geminicoccaceae bacterium]|nr:hypothetical protein [Geminicoccaceae bacterium]
MSRWITLAEVESIVGGGVKERREKIRQAGLANDLRWTRERFPNGLTRWVQPTDWLPEPEWENGRLGSLPGHPDRDAAGLEFRRDCVLSCFGVTGIAKNRGGRPQEWDWEGAAIGSFGQVYRGNAAEPKRLADVERLLSQWFLAHRDKAPAESEVRKHARKLLEEFKKAGN